MYNSRCKKLQKFLHAILFMFQLRDHSFELFYSLITYRWLTLRPTPIPIPFGPTHGAWLDPYTFTCICMQVWHLHTHFCQKQVNIFHLLPKDIINLDAANYSLVDLNVDVAFGVFFPVPSCLSPHRMIQSN